MTDFQPDSAWAEPVLARGGASWENTRPVLEPSRSDAPQRRPAAALASDVNELLESMARKRVPRLDAVRERLQQSRGAGPLTEAEDALHALHAATGAVDFLAGRSGGERAGEFIRHGEALAATLRGLAPRVAEFLQREAVAAPVTRLVWVDLVMESGSLRKRVRQAAQWLAEMDQDLVIRRRGSNTEVMLRAIDELARRAVTMHERLQAVHRLCNQARAIHALSEEIAAERAALWATLQDRVLPDCGRLDDALQPLLHAAAYRALVPTELVVAIDACHALQVGATQAAAQIVRLRTRDQELAAQLGEMEEKARRLTRQG
jgi:hypothetical protein